MIIFINGSINSGKSTVAKLLAEKLKRSALVEIDNLHSFIAWMEINEAVPINLENAVAVIKNFAKRGLNVIVPYPLSQKNYDYIQENIKGLDERIYVFTLNPDKVRALSNTKERTLSDWEKNRIEHHYKIGINVPSFGKIIDNTKQTPEETASIILQEVTADREGYMRHPKKAPKSLPTGRQAS